LFYCDPTLRKVEEYTRRLTRKLAVKIYFKLIINIFILDRLLTTNIASANP